MSLWWDDPNSDPWADMQAYIKKGREQMSQRGGYPSITCPKCGLTSWNPGDIRAGYCGRCHDWTTEMSRPRLLPPPCPECIAGKHDPSIHEETL